MFNKLFNYAVITVFVCINNGNIIEVHSQFGTKTAYREVENKDDQEIRHEGCEPTKLWFLVRHGTRYPNAKLITAMKNRLPKLRDDILLRNGQATGKLAAELDAFRRWNCRITEAEEKTLTHEGEEEMIRLAERMQNRFPTLLPSVYSNTTYKFKFTATQRTEQSAKSFAVGLFGRGTAKDVWFPEPSDKDPVLRFYKLCNKWRKEIKKNPETLNEKVLFESTVHVRDVLRNVTDYLNVTEPLSLADVHLMYMTCAFETAWNKNYESPWCSAFTDESLRVKQFVEDLRYYWVDGYGHELTYKQACPAFENMVSFFRRPESNPKAIVYFTHSGTLLKMLAHLGLYRDAKPLTHNDYGDAKRSWRVNRIDAFGTNLAFVFYRCEGNEDKVLVLHQEYVIRLPSCPDTDLCDFNRLLNYYQSSVEHCSFMEMCN